MSEKNLIPILIPICVVGWSVQYYQTTYYAHPHHKVKNK